MDCLIHLTEPSPRRTLQPWRWSEYISSVCRNGWFGGWMITWGWSWMSGPLWLQTASPPLFGSDGRPGLGQMLMYGTTPNHVLSEIDEERSPTKIVFERPSDTAATRVCEFL